MSVLASSRTTRRPSGPRRLDTTTDLSPVADLIEGAFRNDLDHEGRRVLKELRQLSRWGVLLWLLRATSPGFEEILAGFVWEEDGRIVGNVSVSTTAHLSSRWRVSNVAVDPGYRRQGIARGLMETTIDHIDRMRGRTVCLQVRDDNMPALDLYEGLGFRMVTAETELYLPEGFAAKTTPDDFEPRTMRREESSRVYALAKAATPQSDQALAPLDRLDFEVDPIQHLSESLAALTLGRRTYRLVVDGKPGLAAYAKLSAIQRGESPHRLTMFIHPQYRGLVENALIRTVSKTLARHAPSELQVRLNADKTQEIEALMALGFAKRRTLATMELHLD